jgi:murein DD-endopeptidase MepM/ murein hydrolase activator NlpD
VNHRPHTRLAAALTATAALAGATVALAQDGGGGPGATSARAASASASAYRAHDGEGRALGYVSVSGTGSRSGGGTSVSASTANYKGRASASAHDNDVRLFGDLVTARRVSVRASATGSGGAATSGSVTQLVVAGESRGTQRGRAVYNMGGYGRLVVLDDSGRGITGLKAKLTQQYGQFPAGSTMNVAYASASARDGSPPPKPDPKPEPKPDPKPDKPEPKPDKPDAQPDDDSRPPKRRRPPRTHTLKTDRGFVFPVYGKHRYSNDWGAPRQNTGAHEGNDIFAEAGTPIVSVCNGTLHRVGTNDVPGNRLYLKCTTGDQFFYAHLAAFADDTRSGLKVEAGHVVGFVGSTGDAEQTPPHLHFEVHPGGGDAVNPYPFLQAWESRRDVPAAAWVKRNDPRAGEQPGTLVVVEDFLSR